MEALLDSSKELDLDLLDRIAEVFYGNKGTGDEVGVVGEKGFCLMGSNQRKNAEQVLKKVRRDAMCLAEQRGLGLAPGV
jgi:hypothetical protein